MWELDGPGQQTTDQAIQTREGSRIAPYVLYERRRRQLDVFEAASYLGVSGQQPLIDVDLHNAQPVGMPELGQAPRQPLATRPDLGEQGQQLCARSIWACYASFLFHSGASLDTRSAACITAGSKAGSRDERAAGTKHKAIARTWTVRWARCITCGQHAHTLVLRYVFVFV